MAALLIKIPLTRVNVSINILFMVKRTGATKRITRADVAKRAGISQTTVAYVLNETPGVKIREETRAKVLRVAKELGYTPNFSARSMKRGKTELVGILTPGLDSQFHPYYAQILHGIYEAAAESDYHFLSLTQERPAKYRRCLEQNYLDGVIVIQSNENWQPLNDVLEHRLPTVTINIEHEFKAPQVSMDYEAAMENAVDILIRQGVKNLLFVHGAWNNQPIQRYLKTFQRMERAHSDQGRRFNTLAIERYQLSDSQISMLLNEGWDGLIVDGYELAREIALQAYFFKTLDDISMITFSETPNPGQLGDTVTILQAQAPKVGQQAWRQLFQQLNGEAADLAPQRVPFKQIQP